MLKKGRAEKEESPQEMLGVYIFYFWAWQEIIFKIEKK